MKKRKKKNRAKGFIVLAFILIALVNSKSFARGTKAEAEIITYTIAPGETLWSIAEEYKAEGEDIREYIYNLKELNNMQTSSIYAGQEIKIKKGL